MLFGVLIYEDVEPIDLATVGVLSMARRVRPEIAICTIAPQRGPVRLSNGLVVQADYGLDDAPQTDALIVTGGPGWCRQAENEALLAFLRARAAHGVLASVCTGGMILAASGVLDGKSATTKREVVDPEYPPICTLRERYAAIDVREGVLVDNGAVVTGGGVSLCIDTTLFLLEKLFDAETAAETARIMEYAVARDANRRAFPPIISDGQNGRQESR